ncbi:MAG: hypothetical protein ACTSW7_01115 [Candidatus Thorarchaeota archaeon]|nr:MAG: hypothetical protein DRQ25_04930 [Candidatus Fermentibacteria bacterium]HEC72025.1 hypothetical protein [Thermoplasmatales archaeon]
MAKKVLSDFTVECHLNGWHCKNKSSATKMVGGNVKILRSGQKFRGDEIIERMVVALEPPADTFRDKATGKMTEVLSLVGGSAKDLRVAFEDRQKELESVSEASVVKPEPTPDPEDDEEEKKEKSKEPKRNPRPPQ